MDDAERLEDEELAAFTDALLAGRLEENSSRPLLADTVEILARVMGPQVFPVGLRRRVLNRVVAEWMRQHPSPEQRLFGLFGRPKLRWAWAAAVVLALVLVSVAVVLFVPAETLEVTGTATGDAGVVVLVVGLVLLGILVLAWFASRR